MSRYIRDREPVSAAPDWMVEFLEKLMASLTERERDAYKLVRGQCYSFAQAARLMGCNKGSVQNFVQRAEKKIALVVRKQTISEGVC
jgi:RNA polymerase sigma-70 factor (ECF subfamily)